MIIRVAYLHMKKDRTYNEVVFDTEKKLILNGYDGHRDAFIEAKVSADVTNLRRALHIDGYQEMIIL